MGFESYKGSIQMAAGMKPAAEGYPLMQSCDIQVAEDGTRLDALLKRIPKIVALTQAKYDALVAEGMIEKDVLYFIIKEDSA